MLIDLGTGKARRGEITERSEVPPAPPQRSHTDPTPMPPRPTGFYARTGYRPTAGRPSLLTEDLIEAFRQVLPTVVYLETAGDLLHVHRKTWTEWVREGRKEDTRLLDTTQTPDPKRELHRRFYLMFRECMAAASERNLNNIAIASERWWQAGAWLESRRNPERWGDKTRELEELRAKLAETEKLVDRLVTALPPEVLAAAGVRQLTGPGSAHVEEAAGEGCGLPPGREEDDGG